jgi:hypothetical protein
MDEWNLDLDYVRAVKHRHEAELMQKPNVVGVGIGQRWHEGRPTGELSLIVNVTRKMSEDDLALEDRIPEHVEDVPVQVQTVGEIQAQGARRERKSRRPWAFWKRWGKGGKIEEGLDLVEDVVDSIIDGDDSKASDEEE